VELVWIGVASALLAAFSFAFSNIFGRELVGREEPMRVIFFSLLAAAIFWMVVHTPAQVVREHYNGAQWGYMFVFAITSVLLPYNFYFAGLKYLSATRAVVTSCLEAVFTITLAAIFLREHMGWPQIVGVVLVLTATIVVQMPAREVELPVA
jgi:drug/metabolite transporter (DMT)-like permease